ncbi:barbiturase [Pseudooceanicola antarcticus]|uniref:Cyclic amide hydrolase n=1 Tax=Pseudooceanicola antarcticus TaxID=1247613 RepID=A0A285HX23_9RHOB|nr:ring-opening amidohydrolase [Pseudooceanicola antarcticus]PJE27507.1 cyanuric acid amidohydrolase [Pseudooceanicola antarcticus]SNY39261.1 barbiturase [Pseudooceanicola antarcticus]
MEIGVFKLGMASPADVSELQELIAGGGLDPAQVVAVIGKTEGNGGANDFTRALATKCFAEVLASARGQTPEEVQEQVAFVWSGGTEGVLSPHATVFTRSAGEAGKTGGRLALGLAMSPDLAPEEIGRMAHVEAVHQATLQALADAGISDPADVHYVQVKGPLLTPARISEAAARGAEVVTQDPNGSKPYARGAMALGVALALGEVGDADVSEAAIASRLDLFSSVASTSAGGELTKCEVLLFGNSPDAAGAFRIGHAILSDALDADAVRAAIADAGGVPEAVFAKAEASATLRGRRTTMLSDADINYERHARAAVGGVIASVTGDPAIFLSGGTEHQCPPGAAPIAVIAKVE